MNKLFIKVTAIVTLVALIGFITGCKKDAPGVPALSAEQAQNLRLIGLDPEKAVLDKNGDIIIEDMFISAATLASLVSMDNPKTANSDELEERQRVVAKNRMIPYSLTPNITYQIEPGFSKSQENYIITGIQQWANASNNLGFIKLTSGAQVKIILDNTLGRFAYGLADIPDGTGPGRNLRINLKSILMDCTVSDSICLSNLVTHEMGHILGFGHNDAATSFDFWVLGSPGPIVVDPTSIMNTGDGGNGMPGLGMLAGPNSNDRKSMSSFYPAAGITIPINGVLAEWVDDNRYNVRIKYNQPGLNSSYTAYVQILQDGIVKKSKFQNIGINAGGYIEFGILNLEPGQYQVKIWGINYRGDFTQSDYSTTTFICN